MYIKSVVFLLHDTLKNNPVFRFKWHKKEHSVSAPKLDVFIKQERSVLLDLTIGVRAGGARGGGSPPSLGNFREKRLKFGQ